MFMIFGPSGRDHDSPNQMFPILETPREFKQFKKKQKPFGNNFFWKYEMSEFEILKMLENMCPDNSEDPSNTFSNILDVGSISLKKHAMEAWYSIWEDMKWEFGIEYKINILQKQEMQIWY